MAGEEQTPKPVTGTIMPPDPLKFPKASGDTAADKGGRPEHEATRENRMLVETMTGFGFIQADIAALLSVSVPTLRKHYRTELATGKIKADALVTQSLFKKAISNKESSASVMAAIFWLRNRAGWTEDVRGGGGRGAEPPQETSTDELMALLEQKPEPPAPAKP